MQNQKFQEWLNYISLERSPLTVDGYRRDVGAFLAAWGRDDHPTTADLLEYFAGIRLKANSKRRIVCSIKGYYLWLLGQASPAISIPIPRAEKRKQRTLSAEQALDLLASFDTSTPLGARNLAICILAIDAGLRSAELCRLTIGNLDLKKRTLLVVVKGGSEKGGVFGEETQRALAQWLAMRPPAKDDTVFVSIRQGKAPAKLTTHGLRALMRRWGANAGDGFKLSPHDLRRTFATLASQGGAPSRLLQVAGRWSDLSMVERYTPTITPEDFAPYSPVKRLMGG